MRRINLSGSALVVIAGCSSGGGYAFSDGGADGTTVAVVGATSDGGATNNKKDSGASATDLPPNGRGKKDAGAPASGATCSPDNVTNFSPGWRPPRRIAGACTATQVQTVIDCLGDGMPNATTCDSVLKAPANKTCIQCAVTPATASTYGPLIENDGFTSINRAGCVALKTGDATATSCGANLQALGECSSFACATNCPVTDDQTMSDYLKCTHSAEAGTCSSYANGAKCVDALIQPGAVASDCDSGTTFTDTAKIFTALFCQ